MRGPPHLQILAPALLRPGRVTGKPCVRAKASQHGLRQRPVTDFSQTDRTPPDQGGRSGHPLDSDLRIRNDIVHWPNCPVTPGQVAVITVSLNTRELTRSTARARWTVERPAQRTGATRRGPRPPGSIVRGTRTGPPGRPRPRAGCEPVWAPSVTSNRGWNARRAKDKAPLVCQP
jgi:hypothetical protein